MREKVGERVQIANVKHGKYATRVVADVLVGGEKLSNMLIAEGLGRPYHGAPHYWDIKETSDISGVRRPNALGVQKGLYAYNHAFIRWPITMRVEFVKATDWW